MSDVEEIEITLLTSKAISPISGYSRPCVIKQSGVVIANFGLARSGNPGDKDLRVYATGTNANNLTISYTHDPAHPIVESESPFDVLPSFTDVPIPYME